ncbi:type VII secretion integral membrane protein EccD [Streptomyces sp. NPDC001927]
MTDTSVAGLCRLTVRAPARTVDLAVPADVPVADLLPTLLRYAGEEGAELEEEGLEHGGWTLQRLGGRPLEEEGTLETLGVRDGEVLFLRPMREALPDVRLDDLVDGIANVTRDRLHGWSPAAGRRLLIGMTATVLSLGLVLLAWPGGPVTTRIVVAGAAGLLLLAGAASASRAVGDHGAAATLGFLAALHLALAGWLLPGGEIAGPDAHHVLGARLLAAGAAGAAGAVLALAAAAVTPPFFLAGAVAALATALAGALMNTLDVPVDGAAAALAAALALTGPFVPGLAFRLSGMRMPALPADAAQLQEGIEPYQGRDVATRTEIASGWMTALYAATGAVCAAALTPLARHPDLAEVLTASVLSLLLLLHGRGLVNVRQRLALVVPGMWGAVLLGLAAGAAVGPEDRPLLLAGVFAVAAALAVASWTVPGRRLLPYWGRAAELLHSALAIALVPLTLWVLGVFGALRSVGG